MLKKRVISSYEEVRVLHIYISQNMFIKYVCAYTSYNYIHILI